MHGATLQLLAKPSYQKLLGMLGPLQETNHAAGLCSHCNLMTLATGIACAARTIALRKIMLGMIRFCQSVSSSAGPIPSTSERARLSLPQNLRSGRRTVRVKV